LLKAAADLVPAGLRIVVYDRLRDVPPYDQDDDGAEPPEPAADLRARIRDADGLLVSTPEYNYGPPGVLKNAIDWASKPTTSNALIKKPVAIMGASPSSFGTVRAQLSLRQSFLGTDSIVVGKPEVMVFEADQRFDRAGRLEDTTTKELVASLIGALEATIDMSHRLNATHAA
jgi:chromate reductase